MERDTEKVCCKFGCSRKFLFKKLFTKEDPIYLHKTLGFLALVSFVYRHIYMQATVGNLGFEGRWIDHATMFVHIALSTSSLIFHVLARRILKRPLIIWHEYRLHTISFTARHVSVYLFATFWPYEKGSDLQPIALFCLVMFWHLVADEITRRHGPGDPNQTTVRVLTNKQLHTSDQIMVYVKYFYAYAQFGAIASNMMPTERLCDIAYNPFIGIQSSAFLMTLFRKSVVRWYSHAFWYTLALFFSVYG